MLKQNVSKFREQNLSIRWTVISKCMNNQRSPAQCRYRWESYILHPHNPFRNSTPWTEEEVFDFI